MKVIFVSSEIALVLKCRSAFDTQKAKFTVYFSISVRASLQIKEDVYNSHLIIFMLKKN